MDILLIDDEASLRRTLRTALESMGRESGLDLLPEMLRTTPALSVVLVTAYASVDNAVEAMRRGAFDYLPKPFVPDQLRLILQRWSGVSRLRREVSRLRD